MKADDFMMEETEELKMKKQMKVARETTMGFLGKAHGLYKRAAKGDPSPTIVGKAIAYLTCFQEMAPEVGIKKDFYQKIVTQLSEKLGTLLIQIDQDSRKTIIQHRADPTKAALEQKKVELREKELDIRIEDNRKPAATATVSDEGGVHVLKVEAHPIPEEAIIKEVSDWLVNSQLGYERAEAQRRAKIAYQPGVPVEELVARACRISHFA
jgi:hypothetical protein